MKLIFLFNIFRIKQLLRNVKELGLVYIILFICLVPLLMHFILNSIDETSILILLLFLVIQLFFYYVRAFKSLYLFVNPSKLYIADLILALIPFLVLCITRIPFVYLIIICFLSTILYLVIHKKQIKFSVIVNEQHNIFNLSNSPESLIIRRRFIFLIYIIYIIAFIITWVTKSYIISIVAIFALFNIWGSLLLYKEPFNVLIMYRNKGKKYFFKNRIISKVVDFIKLSIILFVLSLTLQFIFDSSTIIVSILVYLILLISIPIIIIIKYSDFNNMKRNIIISGVMIGLIFSSFISPFFVIIILLAVVYCLKHAVKSLNILLLNDNY